MIWYIVGHGETATLTLAEKTLLKQMDLERNDITLDKITYDRVTDHGVDFGQTWKWYNPPGGKAVLRNIQKQIC